MRLGHDGGGYDPSILGTGEAALSVVKPTGEGPKEVQDTVGRDPKLTEPRGVQRYGIFHKGLFTLGLFEIHWKSFIRYTFVPKEFCLINASVLQMTPYLPSMD